ncbi:MAG: hypothetical protein H6934_06280 [Burkholderiaceae bacterium]|nr:hypothetical protein [Burkholderiaceae bacterium]
MIGWQFSDTIGHERTSALLRAPAFDEIVETIAREMQVVCCHQQECDDAKGFSRVVFNFRVPCTTFDLFFNSEHGYRGSYYLSSHTGLAANEAVISRLSPLLLQWAEQHDSALDQRLAAGSLDSPSAKVWLSEFGSHLCKHCVGEWGNPSDEAPEVLNRRWELADSPNAYRGRKAPCLSKLKVFGAFLNDRHDEFVSGRKRHRARDINAWGWS